MGQTHPLPLCKLVLLAKWEKEMISLFVWFMGLALCCDVHTINNDGLLCGCVFKKKKKESDGTAEVGDAGR